MLFILTIPLLFHVCNCFLLVDQTPRNITKQLTVSNGGTFGTWGLKQFCPDGEFAIGYDIKVESYQYTGDDTSLNAIRLICSDIKGSPSAEKPVTSAVGDWGDWQGRATCNQRPGVNLFLKAFSLQVEPPQGSGDDTAVNWAKFQCRDMEGNTPLEELNKLPGHGQFGSFGNWSDSCTTGSAICGMRTLVEAFQSDGDDTALNDAIFYCCQEA
ncbi:vitelline membrane outer layer protein 1-like [Mya arenaria]|uniref:vitelline membrane outer layer protein 1-like n=1 Tax=Mya arenaria TaxID=6604 RepID=UPI0022E837E1|nr:vitelline membrane outer layer protein 1-like [Mya arenaria]